jgi:hypothetical protein
MRNVSSADIRTQWRDRAGISPASHLSIAGITTWLIPAKLRAAFSLSHHDLSRAQTADCMAWHLCHVPDRVRAAGQSAGDVGTRKRAGCCPLLGDAAGRQRPSDEWRCTCRVRLLRSSRGPCRRTNGSSSAAYPDRTACDRGRAHTVHALYSPWRLPLGASARPSCSPQLESVKESRRLRRIATQLRPKHRATQCDLL